ncbi:unnamed protein product, partial [Allacma fusca]
MSWDDPLPENVLSSWMAILQTLKSVAGIKIPRHAKLPSSKLELLGFCDASEKAYAADVYLRSVNADQISNNLLTAKTRVAPKKHETLPRLELCGALLLDKLLDTVKSHLRHPIEETHLWTDSTIVLSWIADPSNWKTFVSNRISTIVKSYPRSCWHHVRSHDNPADCASRGINPKELEDHPLWWHGPS